MFHFYSSSVGGEANGVTQETSHPSPNVHPHLLLRCILCDQHTSVCALWLEVEKKWLQIREPQITDRVFSFNKSVESEHVQAHVYIHAHISGRALWFMFSSMCAAR